MSVIVNPRIINLYSKCPKRCQFDWTEPQPLPWGPAENIVAAAIKEIYLTQSRRGRVPKWQMVVRAVEKATKRQLQIHEPQRVYKEAKNILTRLHYWYENIFSKYPDSGIINVPIELTLDYEVIYKDNIELITIGEKVRVMDFSTKPIIGSQLYNDFEVQVRIWGFFRASETLPHEFIRLLILPASVKTVPLYITLQDIDKTERIVRHLLRGMKEGIFYPVFTDYCSSCPYRVQCSY